MKGFFERILTIDLSNRESRSEPLDDDILRKTLGGKGLATHLLLEKNPPGVDPFGPENRLVLALGPVTDSALYGSCRHGVFAKSPQTGFLGHSYSGGKLAVPMSRTGYDAVVIEGSSERPVWLEITDREVRFHDASDLWGRDTYSTEDEIKRRLDSPKNGVMVIGPAGENRVRFAAVKNDHWRSAGRTGMGAVLGAKRVKAVAFHGKAARPHAHPDEIKAYAKDMLKRLNDHKVTHSYRNLGTPATMALLIDVGGFPTRYWSEGVLDRWEKINAESMKERLKVKPKACTTCFMACGKLGEVQEGRHKGLELEGPEYETLFAIGGLCLIGEIEEVVYLNDICDRAGLDTISAGNMAAFAIEASRRGRIDESLEYGDPDGIADLLRKIAKREGIGDLLAEGIRAAAAELDLEDIAIHVKGMEPAGYDPRALKGMGLAYAVSDRGACHMRCTIYKPELSGLIDPHQIEGKAEIFVDYEDRCTLHDCLILCRFFRDFYLWDELRDAVSLTTGLDLNKSELQKLAAQVSDNARRFNLREGLTAADDRLPKRFFDESLPDGQAVTEKEMATLVGDYYRLRGWSAEGIPSA